MLIVASVSCIYGIGSPDGYEQMVLLLAVGEEHPRERMLRKLVTIQYSRNDVVLGRGKFRVRGDVIEVQPANMETAYRISLFGDEIERISHFDPITGEVLAELDAPRRLSRPRTTRREREQIERAVGDIEAELEEQVASSRRQGKLLEAHRLRQRTEYDMEMLREMGFCNGIENYSRILDGRDAGDAAAHAARLLPRRLPRASSTSRTSRCRSCGGMYEGDRSPQGDAGRPRLPAAVGARQPAAALRRVPATRVPQACSCRPRPGTFELRQSTHVVEQIIRPTGLIDPEVEVRPDPGQVDDLLTEIRGARRRGERVLVTTLTKKMAEDLTEYLLEAGVRTRYLHSEVDTLERIQIVRDLRLGEYDVLVGVNLLREGLDLPEVSLVAILDADKEGFLRGADALIQTIGRAARNINGRVIMYADKQTEAIRVAIDETNRRRDIQVAYNAEHGITPQSIRKGVSDIAEFLALETRRAAARARRAEAPRAAASSELEKLVVELEEEMFAAAEELRFEYAARLRDEIKELRRELGMAAPPSSDAGLTLALPAFRVAGRVDRHPDQGGEQFGQA